MASSQDDDTFDRFLTLVTESLADAGRPLLLSERLFLSRSQVDRIVVAAAGEPPAAMRRRILLERAAYRLVTEPDRTLLDVGVEAGYASHEAFTRAFIRGYGVPPSAWRARPSPIGLEAPNRIHFHPPAGLRLPAVPGAPTMDLPTQMIEHHVWLVGEQIERAGRLGPTQLDAPITLSVAGIDATPTLRSLLSRLVGQLDQWNQSMRNEPYDFAVERDETLSSMRRRLGAAGPEFVERVRDAVTAGSLDEAFVDATVPPPVFFTYGGMLAHVLTYGAYRRTLVTSALEQAGVTDLQDDPLAWEPIRPAGPTMP